MKKQQKIPVILYEQPSSKDEKAIPFPYIEVEKEETMPPVLFILEYKHTGEFEPDNQGKECPIVDQLMHSYCDMQFLQEKLHPDLYDQVRVALGMKPLQEAKKEGQKILDKVFQVHNVEKENLTKDKEYKKTEVKKIVEGKFNKVKI